MKYINFITLCLFFCSQLMAMKRSSDDINEGMSIDLILNKPLFLSLEKLDDFFVPSNNDSNIDQLDDYLYYIYKHEEHFHNDMVISTIISRLDPSKPSYGFIKALYESLHGNFSLSNLDNNVSILISRYNEIKNEIENNNINRDKINNDNNDNNDNKEEMEKNIDIINDEFDKFVNNIDPKLRGKINININDNSLTITHNYFGLPPLPQDLLKAIGKLKLKYIRINWDRSGESFPLAQFIDYLAHPETLEEADFSHTDLKYVPDNIMKLTSLTKLNLADNDINDLSHAISSLPKLKDLNLSGNNLKFIPHTVFNIVDLQVLNLSYNYINYIDENIGKLSSLQRLNLSHNSLAKIHGAIGELTDIVNLDLSSNHLCSLPKSISNLKKKMITFNLSNNHIIERSNDDDNYGQGELEDIFGDRIVISFTSPIKDIITEKELYDRLDEKGLRINRDKLKNTKKEGIPHINMTPYEFISYWSQLLYSLNFDDDSRADYLSYEILIGDFKDDNLLPTNKENITQKLLPRLNGFIKTLWGFELDDQETPGWQISKHNLNDMKIALAYIIKTMVEMDDSTFRATLFYQLVNGLLYCPTGQKEGIERVVSALTSRDLANLDSITESIAKWVAMKKEEIFASTITPGGRAQNVYVLAKYRRQLQDKLGLTIVFSDFIIEEPFFDPYGGDGNALAEFYNHFTPDNLALWFILDSENKEDYDLADKLYKLQKEYFSLTNPEKKEANQKDQQKIKDQQKTSGSLFKIKDILNLLFQQGLLNNKWMDDFGYDEDQPDLGLSARLKSLQEEEALIDNLSAKTELIYHILKMQEVLGKSENKINAYKSYLLEHKLLHYDWSNYFSSDPISINGRPLLTKEGALRILHKLGYISGSFVGKFESNTIYNMFATSANDK